MSENQFQLSGSFKFITPSGRVLKLSVPAKTPIAISEDVFNTIYNASMEAGTSAPETFTVNGQDPRQTPPPGSSPPTEEVQANS